MRVAFINQTGAKPGGAEESLALLLHHLPSDIEPLVVMYESGEFAERLQSMGVATHVVNVPSNVRTVPRERAASAAALAAPAVVAGLTRFLARERFDLVHTNTMKAHLLGAPAARLAGLPCVMHVRDMVEGPGRTAMRLTAAVCSRERIAISSALSRWYGMGKTTVVANPVDLSRYRSLPGRAEARSSLGIDADGIPLVGIVGRINRWKGHDRLLRAMATVNAVRPMRCAIIGEARFRDADFVPELHALARELGLTDRVTFIPWLDDPRLAYAALDVHCNASEREPFGRSIVEAAAAGVPTVAFDDGGAVDIIRDGIDGVLVPARDESALAGALAKLLGDASLRERMGSEAKDGSVRFDAPEHARRVASILRRAAARQRAGNLAGAKS